MDVLSGCLHWVEDSTSSEQGDVVELLHAVGHDAGRVYVTWGIAAGKLSLDSSEQLPSGSHTAIVVIK